MRKALLLVLTIVAMTAIPAAADHMPGGVDWVPNLRTERVYFHCEGATKVHSTVADGSIGWNTTAPTQSVTAGAGCGSPDGPVWGNNQASVQDSHFEGTYTANLDSITVEAHNIYVGGARAGGPLSFNVRLAVDGAPRLGANGTQVNVTPVRSATGASEMVRFTITGLNLLTEFDDMEHHILLTLAGGKQVNGQAYDTVSAWVYDTTEVPSGLTFNPTTAETVTVAAQPVEG